MKERKTENLSANLKTNYKFFPNGQSDTHLAEIVIMNIKANISTLGKYLDQPMLVGKFSKSVPVILGTGSALVVAKKVKEAPKGEKGKVFLQNTCVLLGTVGSALIATRGIKKLGIKGLANPYDLKEIGQNNTKLINDFLETTGVSRKTERILEKAKTKAVKFREVKRIFSEIKPKEGGDVFLKKLIPDPENISSKDIFKEIKRLSVLGLVPVIGGIGGGILGDRLTDKQWKEKIPNKIKEGSYQYLANIFMCNVGAGIALGLLEKAKITSKSARAVGMTTGIVLTGILGGSAIANTISKKIIDPIFRKTGIDKSEKESGCLYSERKPEALDIGLHTDDIATVAVLSGLKWIEPALPILYSISGYRAGIGYRNGEGHKH